MMSSSIKIKGRFFVTTHKILMFSALVLAIWVAGCGPAGSAKGDGDSDTLNDSSSATVEDTVSESGDDSATTTGTDDIPDTASISDDGTDTTTETHSELSTDTAPVCVYNDRTWQIGDRFANTDGCNECTCMLMSDDEAGVACSDTVCAQPCVDLSETDCDQTSSCRAIRARAIDATEACLEPATFVGCISADVECDQAITLATSDDGCWQFTDGCMPAVGGWAPVGGSLETACGISESVLPTCSEPDTDSDTDSAPLPTCEYGGNTYDFGDTFPQGDGCNTCFCDMDAAGNPVVGCTTRYCGPVCESLNEAACKADTACTSIMATPYDPDSRCMSDPVFVGCMAADTGCTAVITYALSNGVCWQFSSGCIPENFRYESTGGTPATGCNMEIGNPERCEANTCDALGETCCTATCPCPTADGTRCVLTNLDTAGMLMGKCTPFYQADAPTQSCWQGSDCEPEQFCEGARVCPCGISCLAPDAIGICVSASGKACNADLDSIQCPDSYICTGMGDEGDICLHKPEGLQCWIDADCDDEGLICKDANPCGSLADCKSRPGTCVPQ